MYACSMNIDTAASLPTCNRTYPQNSLGFEVGMESNYVWQGYFTRFRVTMTVAMFRAIFQNAQF